MGGALPPLNHDMIICLVFLTEHSYKDVYDQMVSERLLLLSTVFNWTCFYTQEKRACETKLTVCLVPPA